MTEVESPEVSVAFAPRQLGGVDQWRFVLRRIYPKSRDALRFGVIRAVLLIGYFGFVGAFAFYMARMTESPWTLAVAGMAVGLIWPLRLWRVKRSLMSPLSELETYQVRTSPEGLTVETATRVLLIRWAGISNATATRSEVVVQLHSPDVVSIPTRAFRDEAHLGRFLDTVRSRAVASAERKARG